MSREMRFRAWDKDSKKMIATGFHVIGEVSMFNMIESYIVDGEKEKPQNERKGVLDRLGDIEIMQYTGLKDKNGNEIYEGDVLHVKNYQGNYIYPIVEYGIHRREMASGNWVDIPGFSFVIDGFASFPIVKNYEGVHDLEIIEVIGNIYQNPELINK